jgi:glutathione S-transferase
MIARHAGITIEDRVVTIDEWRGEWKAKMPKGQVPVLKLEDDSLMPESADIARFLAAKAGPPLMPVDEAAIKSAEELWDVMDATGPWCSEDVPRISVVNPLLNFHDQETAEPKLAAYRRGLPLVLDHLETVLSGGNPFVGGTAPNYAEFWIFHNVDLIRTLFGLEVFDGRTAVTSWLAAMDELPAVKEYLSERPQAGTGTVGTPASIIFKHSDPANRQ